MGNVKPTLASHSTLSSPAQAAAGATRNSETTPQTVTHAWAVSEEKLRLGRLAEESRKQTLWHQFLAGDDRPVGNDVLPPPEMYYGMYASELSERLRTGD